ncbi:MAG: cytochrome c [Burkholderiaceae bacterium]
MRVIAALRTLMETATKRKTILMALLPMALAVLLAITLLPKEGNAEGPVHSAPDAGTDSAANVAEVARGAYLARLGDCSACHSVPGMPDFTGGLAIHSPLGTIYTTNITPDRETGIGNYSLRDFDRALREGESPRHRLYPAMPYPSFTKISSDDIRALYAYFMQGVTPVRRVPPATKLPFPFDQRWGMALWNVAFLDAGVYRYDVTRNQSWNRGAYLVQGLGHCGSCHTPRGLAYQEHGYSQRSADYLTGGVNDLWFAPNLSGNATVGLGNWDVAQIVQFLKTGHGAATMAFGPMKQVVADSLQHVDDSDLASIATYLKSLVPRPKGDVFRPDTGSARTVAWLASGDVHVPGGGLYNNFCAKCHKADGRGEKLKAPALAGSGVVRSSNPASVIHIILSGGKPHLPPGMAAIDAMPAFDGQFDDRQVAEVASFVRRSWGNAASPVTTRTVRMQRAAIAAEKN